MSQRIGHCGFAQQVVIGETVVVQAAVAPAMHHAPLPVVVVIERQADPVGVLQHPVLAVDEPARCTERVLGSDQVAIRVAIGHRRMAQASGRVVQAQQVDPPVARLHFE
nr:hypothetical protein [Xanthomonas oryzae]